MRCLYTTGGDRGTSVRLMSTACLPCVGNTVIRQGHRDTRSQCCEFPKYSNIDHLGKVVSRRKIVGWPRARVPFCTRVALARIQSKVRLRPRRHHNSIVIYIFTELSKSSHLVHVRKPQSAQGPSGAVQWGAHQMLFSSISQPTCDFGIMETATIQCGPVPDGTPAGATKLADLNGRCSPDPILVRQQSVFTITCILLTSLSFDKDHHSAIWPLLSEELQWRGSRGGQGGRIERGRGI